VDTYWYIQAVPELLQLATERLKRTPEGTSDDGLKPSDIKSERRHKSIATPRADAPRGG
jgi:hypothetical protein